MREPRAEAPQSAASEADAQSAEPSSAALEALERAAENIRPSWHGAELPPASADHAALPAALPPPPALPAFSSFPIEQDAPHYRADSTVRTAAILPERLAQLLSQPQIADASHWLRTRPRARAGLMAVGALLLVWLLWPSSPEAPPKITAKPKATSSVPALPIPSAPGALQPQTPAGESEAIPSKQPEPEPPALSVKKRDKRKASAAKTTLAKAPVAKPSIDKTTTVKAPIDKAAALKAGSAKSTESTAKTRKTTKAAPVPAR